MPAIKINDKYTVIHDNGIGLRAERYGEPWRDLTGDGLVLAMAQEIESLRDRMSQVNNWIVCACIASPEDMMQNAEHIERITSPSYSD